MQVFVVIEEVRNHNKEIHGRKTCLSEFFKKNIKTQPFFIISLLKKVKKKMVRKGHQGTFVLFVILSNLDDDDPIYNLIY